MPRFDLWSWSVPVIVLQLVGLTCLIISTSVIYTAWHGLGVFGFALLAVGEIRAGRKVPLI